MKLKTLEPAPKRLAEQLYSRELLESMLAQGEIRDLLERGNAEYLYWDKIKHLAESRGQDPGAIWNLLKITRTLTAHDSPVQDVAGKPFRYSLVPELLYRLHRIDQLLQQTVALDDDRLSSAWRKRFLVNSLMEEAIASSQIEGASTTTNIAKDMLRAGRKPIDRAERMILNNFKTMQRVKGLVDKPITPGLICELQSSMTDGTLSHSADSGRFRDTDDIVVIDGQKNEVLHVPPPASELEYRLGELCAYANDISSNSHVPVVDAIVVHFWLAYLHPFVDGNGRTARALFYLLMLKQGYWVFEYLAISRVILGRRGQYEKAYLYSEQDDNDLTYFIMFNMQAIEQSITEFREYAASKAQEDLSLQARLKADARFSPRQRAILARALKDPDLEVTIESHAASHEIAYATSRSDLLSLVEAQLLVQVKRGRKYVFVPAEGFNSLLLS